MSELIQTTRNYGGIKYESQFWNDYKEMGEDLLKYKIIKLKIYTGTYEEKEVIFGISYILKNIMTGELKPEIFHNVKDYIDVKEYNIKGNEYLTDFHIRFPNSANYISQIGFETNKKTKFLIGTEEGEDKKISSNGGKNIILGTFGCLNKKLDAMGCLYVSKKEYSKRTLFPYLMLRVKIKNDKKFKEEYNKKYKELPIEYQYLWKTIFLPDAVFSQIIKYCFI